MLNPNERSSFDALLQIAIHEELTYLDPKLQALLKETENDDLPPEVDAYLVEFAKKKKKTDAKIQRRRKMPRYIKNVALFVIGIGITVNLLYYNVSAFKVYADNILHSISEKYNELTFRSQYLIDPDNIEGAFFLPTSLPNGLSVQSSERIGDVTIITYVNEDGTLFFRQRPFVNTTIHDAGKDNGEINTEINGVPGRLMTRDGESVATWCKDGTLFTITSNLDPEIILTVADSVFSVK